MKKKVFYLLFILFSAQLLSAQELDIFKPQAKPLNDKKNAQVRSYVKSRGEDVVWYKTVYRIIDLKEKINQPLYFPTEPVGDRLNLFSCIFNAVASCEVKGYAFDINSETFSPDNEVDFEKDVLVKNGMAYSQARDPLTNEPKGFDVDAYSIPTSEVKKYYVKEVWYFDKHTSIFRNQILAICPVWEKVDDDGVPQRIPLFWVLYHDMEPFFAGQRVVTKNKNIAQNLTFDGFFKKRFFHGNIYKEGNVLNRTLIEYCTTRDEAAEEQRRIEDGLVNYESDLWEY